MTPWTEESMAARELRGREGFFFLLKVKKWALKKCFWTVVLEKTLESPWTARRSNQSILKEINPESSLEGLMLKLKLQYFGHLMWRADDQKRPWCWASLKAGGEGDARGWDGWMASPTRWTWVWVNSGSWWWTGRPGVLRLMGSPSVGHDWSTELNWTELNGSSKNLLVWFIFKALEDVVYIWT